jgi:hypothetical protein
MSNEKYHNDSTYGEECHNYRLIIFGLDTQVESGEPGSIKYSVGNSGQYQHFNNNSNGSQKYIHCLHPQLMELGPDLTIGAEFELERKYLSRSLHLGLHLVHH